LFAAAMRLPRTVPSDPAHSGLARLRKNPSGQSS
jgi:hypothetical protein